MALVEKCPMCRAGVVKVVDHEKRVVSKHPCPVCLGNGKLRIALDNPVRGE